MMKGHDHRISLKEELTAQNTPAVRMIRRAVIIGCIVNVFLTGIKLGFGYFGHSDALWADGFHSLGDACSDLVMLVFVGLSFHKPGSDFAYGYGKFETLASILISCVLLYFSITIFANGVDRIISYTQGEILPHPDGWTIVAIVIAMFAKEGLFRFYKSVGKRTRSQAMLSSAWHHRADALSSIATLVGVTLAHFGGDSLRIFDPCVSLLIAVMIFVAAVRLIVPAFLELMDVSAPASVRREARETIDSTHGVESIIELKSRKSGPFYIFDIKIGVRSGISVDDGYKIAEDVRKRLIERFGSNILIGISTLPDNQGPVLRRRS